MTVHDENENSRNAQGRAIVKNLSTQAFSWQWLNAPTRHHSWSVAQLHGGRCTSSEAAYHDLRAIAEDARTYSIAAKHELDSNVARHQC